MPIQGNMLICQRIKYCDFAVLKGLTIKVKIDNHQKQNNTHEKSNNSFYSVNSSGKYSCLLPRPTSPHGNPLITGLYHHGLKMLNLIFSFIEAYFQYLHGARLKEAYTKNMRNGNGIGKMPEEIRQNRGQKKLVPPSLPLKHGALGGTSIIIKKNGSGFMIGVKNA